MNFEMFFVFIYVSGWQPYENSERRKLFRGLFYTGISKEIATYRKLL
jgi:hypothetical protein